MHAIRATSPVVFERKSQGQGQGVAAVAAAGEVAETNAQQWGHIPALCKQRGQPTGKPGGQRRRVPAACTNRASTARDQIETPPKTHEKTKWIREYNAVALFPISRYPQEGTLRKRGHFYSKPVIAVCVLISCTYKGDQDKNCMDWQRVQMTSLPRRDLLWVPRGGQQRDGVAFTDPVRFFVAFRWRCDPVASSRGQAYVCGRHPAPPTSW